MEITRDIRFVGVNDCDIRLFEGQYRVKNGMSYNSYVITDEKVAVMDSVDASFADEWLHNVKRALAGRAPDYLIVQHMEPDHSASIMPFARAYPEARIVSSKQAFEMMRRFFGVDFAERRIVVGEGDVLFLGRHELVFFTAPMVHWPEVIVTYDKTDRVLFSADGFGKFGRWDAREDWVDEARRYYFGIVGKYGKQVQALLKKAITLDLSMICPLHGPVLRENLSYYLDLYDKWSGYRPEEEGVVIAYTSVYSNTRLAVDLLARRLSERGQTVRVFDLSACDTAEAVANAFRYSKLVLATTTYNGGVFPFMREFLCALTERDFRERTVAFIENGTWAPTATRTMRKMLEGARDLTYTDATVTIHASLNAESKAQLDALAAELV